MTSTVMAGLVPAIPIGNVQCSPKRDARHKAGHDKRETVFPGNESH